MGSSLSRTSPSEQVPKRRREVSANHTKKQRRPSENRSRRVVNNRRRHKKYNGPNKSLNDYDPYNARYIKSRDLGNGVKSVFVVSPDGRNCSFYLQSPVAPRVYPQGYVYSPTVQPIQYIAMAPHPRQGWLPHSPQMYHYQPQAPGYYPYQYQQFYQPQHQQSSSSTSTLRTQNIELDGVSIDNISIQVQQRSSAAALERALKPIPGGNLLSTNVLEPENLDLVTICKQNMEELDRQVAISLLEEDEYCRYPDNTPGWIIAQNDFQLAMQLELGEDDNMSEEDIYNEIEEKVFKLSMETLQQDEENRSAKEFMKSCQDFMNQKQVEKEEELEEYDEGEYICFYSDSDSDSDSDNDSDSDDYYY